MMFADLKAFTTRACNFMINNTIFDQDCVSAFVLQNGVETTV